MDALERALREVCGSDDRFRILRTLYAHPKESFRLRALAQASGVGPRDERADARIAEAEQAWLKFPEQNKARFLMKMIVPYTAIADIDDLGDEFVEAPHVYASMDGSWLVLEEVVAGGREIRIRDEADRICRFPNSLRVDPEGIIFLAERR